MSKIKAQVETKDLGLPKSEPIDLSGGVDSVDLAMVTDADIDTPWLKELSDDLAFNEQIVTFSIGRDSNPNAENPVPCGCNGKVYHLRRGERHRLPRKFVDSLIRTTFRVETEEYVDDKGLKQTRVHRIPCEAYPISIHDDPANADGSNRGTQWLEFQRNNSF